MSSTSEENAPAPARIMSVDALRGFDMFWIIGGQGVVASFLAIFLNPMPEWLDAQFDHVPWAGFAAWDLIMPLFLFIVGTSMPFSFGKRLESGQARAALYRKILRRVALLWVFGMMVQGHLLEFDLSQLHFYSNTLQSIAIGYLVAVLLMLHTSRAVQAAVTAVLLIGYWLLLTLVPVPGHGAGVLEEHLNLAMYVDETILGRFRDGTTYTWILSSLGFAATTLLGVFSGYVVKAERPHSWKLAWLCGLGLACLLGGWVWGIWHPIIKHIWTSSMVLWAAGWSFLLLALFYGVIDVLGYRKWAFPFVIIGMNAIAAYMGAHLIPFDAIGEALASGLAQHLFSWGAFVLASVNFGVIWLILYYMYRNKTFLKV